MNDSKTKSRLGRGLSSLISLNSDIPAENPTAVLEFPASASEPPFAQPGEIPIDQIAPNPHQPRRTINPAAIAELAASLKTTGLIQPIIVRKSITGFELIAGERRLRAAKLAGFQAIPAIVREVDRFSQAQMALVENIQREDLNPIDRAAAYKALIEQLKLTQSELAQRLGEDRSSIANHLRLLDLSQAVRQLVSDGRLSLGHAKLLAGVGSAGEQDRLANLVVARELSVRQLEKLIQGKTIQPRDDPSAAYINELEKSLSRQLNLRVRVRANKKGRGRLVIHYQTLDEFDRLMAALGVKVEE
jgi:ParB family transcriptional regulator, chromosome partitioning protein